MLDTLLGSFDKGTFFNEFWERQPLHVNQQVPNRFANLFSIDELDYLFSALPKSTPIALMKNDMDKPDQPGQRTTTGANIGELYNKFSQGHTIIVSGMHLYWEPVRTLCMALVSELGFETKANMYVTPPNTMGFSPHWDDHDVAVLQISGEKLWRIYGNGPELPRRTDSDLLASISQRTLAPGEPVKELVMRPGDLLYLPRGWVHNARATSTTSIHLTLGISPSTWESLLIGTIQDFSKKHPALRKALPVGALTSQAHGSVMREKTRVLLQEVLDGFDVEGGLDLLARALIKTQESLPTGHFSQLAGLPEIHLETQVTRRTLGLVRCVEGLDYAGLIWPGYYQHGPEKMCLAFEFIAQNDTFKVNDIPGWYSDNEKIMTVRHLVGKGLLKMVPSS